MTDLANGRLSQARFKLFTKQRHTTFHHSSDTRCWLSFELSSAFLPENNNNNNNNGRV